MSQAHNQVSGPVAGFLRKTRVLSVARRLAPVTFERVRQYYSIKSQVKNGYLLVDVPELERAYEKAVAWLLQSSSPAAIGDYLEFGVFYGSSLACMHRVLDKHGLTGVRLFGFDSFDGLPESSHPDDKVWAKGEFKSSFAFAKEFLNQNKADWKRVHLEKGWFSDTLTESFRRTHAITKASLIMVDCDMYLSAKQALSFCAPLIKDRAVLFFDDWNSAALADKGQGEKRAFDEFLQENSRLKAEEFGTYAYQGKEHAKVFTVSVTH